MGGVVSSVGDAISGAADVVGDVVSGAADVVGDIAGNLDLKEGAKAFLMSGGNPYAAAFAAAAPATGSKELQLASNLYTGYSGFTGGGGFGSTPTGGGIGGGFGMPTGFPTGGGGGDFGVMDIMKLGSTFIDPTQGPGELPKEEGGGNGGFWDWLGRNAGDLAKAAVNAYAGYASYKDQQRINDQLQQAYEQYQREKEQFRGKIRSGDLRGLPIDRSVPSKEQVISGYRPVQTYQGGGIVEQANRLAASPQFAQMIQNAFLQSQGIGAMPRMMMEKGGDVSYTDYGISGVIYKDEKGNPISKEEFLEKADEEEFFYGKGKKKKQLKDILENPEEVKKMLRNKKAEGGIMNLKGKEMDMRGGGFVPIGKKERADDVPARLSLNEFVMTADAVRGAGNGNIKEGARRMYQLMNNLEAK